MGEEEILSPLLDREPDRIKCTTYELISQLDAGFFCHLFP
jgi:hypothetical protein